MARKIPAGRFEDLVRNAIEVFIAHGYRHTQMADIAQAVGVSKGTLYLYVESKEALFALCLRQASRIGELATPADLPIPTPPAGELAGQVAERLSAQALPTTLSLALKRRRADDIRGEIDAIFRELYDTMERYSRSIKLLDRCWDHPELGQTWKAIGREAPRNRLADYVALRMNAGQIRRHPKPDLLARIALETVTTWAVHIKWDRNPQDFDPQVAKEEVLGVVVRGLLADDSRRGARS